MKSNLCLRQLFPFLADEFGMEGGGFLTDISQYRLRLGSPLLYKSEFHLNHLTAQLSYEGRAAVEGVK
jgi:hypothetical protein